MRIEKNDTLGHNGLGYGQIPRSVERIASNSSNPVYTIQPVVKPVVQPVLRLAASCKETSNRL